MPGAGPSLSARDREARQLALIHRVARIATATLPLGDKLQRVVLALKQHLRCELVACVAIDAAAGRFRCAAIATDVPTAIHVGYGRPIGSGVVGEVAAHGRTLHVPDVRTHANYVETMPGTRSELCVPVRHNGEVIAVLNAECRREDAFAGSAVLVETVAEQVAGIFASNALDEEQRRRTRLVAMIGELMRTALEAEGLDATLQRIVEFFLARFALESCAVLLADDTGEHLRRSARAGRSIFHTSSDDDWPATRGVIGRAFRTGQAQHVADVAADPDYLAGNDDVVAEFALPVRFRGRVIGVLNLETAHADTFDEANRQTLTVLAEQIAGAIHVAVINERLSLTNRLVEEKSAALIQANTRLREVNARLERLSHMDGLTGIANRRRFDEGLTSEWRRALRHEHPLALLLVDIDEFKPYNDGYGHLAGDDALRRVAVALSGALSRATDLVARYGGEEFAVLLPETGIDEALRAAEHLRGAVQRLNLQHAFARAGVLSVSIGVASTMPDAKASAADFVARADRALYRAKAGGRDRIEVDTPGITDE
jgi:diguanylate cyclase (GGDEF)-like protein